MMSELLSSLLATAKSFVPQTVPLLLGFISAWGLFELTERRRVGLAQRELRHALVAELENVEVLVSTIIAKYARLCRNKEDVVLVANEIRWFYSVGRQRLKDVGIVSDLPTKSFEIERLSDEQLVGIFSSVEETIGTKIIVPIVERVLAGHISGFRASQIQALSTVRWQAYMLEQDADFMKDMLGLSLTVTDEGYHKAIIKNHENRTMSYALRSRTLLRAIRAALQLMRK